MTRDSQTVVETTVRLWEELAPELILIIGESGFKPLYARSIRLICVQYPWMAQDATTAYESDRFVDLQARLQGQDALQARQASVALFTIFLELLASLIGEALTAHLLQLAWNQETSEAPARDFSK